MAENWLCSREDDDTAYNNARQWNERYTDYFGSVHSSLSSREKLIRHLDKDLRLVFTSGKIATGRRVIENEIEGDLVYGNRFSHIEVMSSGPLSVIEVHNTNSPEFPGRCPSSRLLVVYREKDRITRINLHNSH